MAFSSFHNENSILAILLLYVVIVQWINTASSWTTQFLASRKSCNMQNFNFEIHPKSFIFFMHLIHTMQGPSVPILIFFVAFCLLVGKYRRWFSHWNVRHGDRSQIFSMCSSPTICNCTSRYKWQRNFLQQNPWKSRNLSRWKFISTTRFETSCWFKKYVDLLCYAKVPIRKIVSIVYSKN